MNLQTDLKKFEKDFMFSIPWDVLNTHFSLLMKWNEITNLVSRGTIKEAAIVHYYDSLKISELALQYEEGRSFFDLGSGAGFPGVVLAALTSSEVALSERIAKKRSFLSVCVAKCKLTNARVCGALERPLTKSVITARAVYQPPEMIPFLERILLGDSIAIVPSARPYPSDVGSLKLLHVANYELPGLGNRLLNVLGK